MVERRRSSRWVACLLLAQLTGATAEEPVDRQPPAEGSLVRNESGGVAPLSGEQFPPDLLAALQDKYDEWARGLFEVSPVKRLRGDRFTVLSDLPDNENIHLISGNLEGTFELLDPIFGVDLPHDGEWTPLTVYVYRHRSRFAAFAAALGADNVDGLYAPPLRMLSFHMEHRSNQIMAQVMLHEATHAYLDQHVRPDSRALPLWFEEGFAEYVGTSTIRKGELLLGSVRAKQRYRDARISVNVKSEGMAYVDLLRKSVRKQGRPTIDELLQLDREIFYGDDAYFYYASAWVWMHFLRHGGPDHAGERFPALIEKLRQETDSIDAVRAAYGNIEELESRFHEYIRGLRN